MDYSNRVNSKKGSGGIAGKEETNIHTKRRIKELLATQVLNLDNDPYVFTNHLGLLECKLCLTTHVSESSYISHLGGRKHQMNLEKRKILDEKYDNLNQKGHVDVVSINNIPKRVWNKIGRPNYKVTKIRDPVTFQVGLLIEVKCPKISINEPLFRIMSFYELSTKNQNVAKEYLRSSEEKELDFQYLVISAEPYENICIVMPNDEIDRPAELDGMGNGYWWHWDVDTKEFFLQLLYKQTKS